jgi:hypothetical protein
MFIIEGMGFGRGLGALDLSSDRIKQYMHVLDISMLNIDSMQAIKDAFLPLTNRSIMSSIADELEQTDRIAFDDAVLRAFNLNVSRQIIYESLLTLVEIRLTARP